MVLRLLFPSGVLLLILSFFSSIPVLADSLCFAKAKTYYEQLYCEAITRGFGSRLPGFYDFQRNDEVTQALLLKGPARQLGVVLSMPVATPKASSLSSVASLAISDAGSTQDCEISGALIVCGDREFHYRPNQLNNALDASVLGETNSMGIEEFTGSYSDRQAANSYLRASYEHYLDKMLVIGLAEATMTYGSFSYLFSDLHDKNVSFSGRFEKMYFYLKQDKKQLAVNRQLIPPENLVLDDCYPLTNFWVCGRNKKNYLYRATD